MFFSHSGRAKFCGRAVCKEHVKTMPHIVALYRDQKNAVQALITPEAIHCGVCKPLGKPVMKTPVPGIVKSTKTTNLELAKINADIEKITPENAELVKSIPMFVDPPEGAPQSAKGTFA